MALQSVVNRCTNSVQRLAHLFAWVNALELRFLHVSSYVLCALQPPPLAIRSPISRTERPAADLRQCVPRIDIAGPDGEPPGHPCCGWNVGGFRPQAVSDLGVHPVESRVIDARCAIAEAADRQGWRREQL